MTLQLGVSFDTPLGEVFRRSEFWSDYLWLTEEDRRYPELALNTITFRVAPTSSLFLHMDSTMQGVSLLMEDPAGGAPLDLGWDDQAHWHPFVFRWVELQAACGHLLRLNPDACPAGLPLMLLARFSILVGNEDLTAAEKLIQASARSIFPAGLPSFERALASRLAAGQAQGLRWSRKPSRGWVLEGDAPYSLRVAENPEFPFAAFNEFLRHCGVDCGDHPMSR